MAQGLKVVHGDELRTWVRVPAPIRCLTDLTPVPGDVILLISMGTKHTNGAQTHTQTKHSHT